MRIGTLAVAVLILLAPHVFAQEQKEAPKPGPFVTVYRDDTLAFQIRRDRIKPIGEGIYTVWLRWLWAEPQPWKSELETSRVIVANVDCTRLRVRELGILHKDRSGKVIESEEWSPEDAPWRTFERESGAAKTVAQVCELIPQLQDASKVN